MPIKRTKAARSAKQLVRSAQSKKDRYCLFSGRRSNGAGEIFATLAKIKLSEVYDDVYIHLGSDTVVSAKDIIGIFDIDYCSISKRTREFLRVAQDSGRVVNVSEELPKSFVLVSESSGDMVYISGVSPATLRKRADTRERTV